MTERFDRSRLPSIDDYCRDAGLTWRSGRAAKQRFDCPLADHTHRGNLLIDADRGRWHCVGGCGGGSVIDLHMARMSLDFVDAACDLGAMVGENAPQATIRTAPAPVVVREPDRGSEADQARQKRRQAAAIWAQTQPISGIARAYLVGRGCALPPADSDLRWLPRLDLFGLSGPALVGRISMAMDATQGVGLHVTWLRQDGARWVRTERRYLGTKSGGVVRLWPDEAVDIGLGIAEGVETSLAAAQLFRPIWACMDAGNLARFPVLAGIDALSVFADNDKSGAGQTAALDCADRWLDAGREVRVFMSAVEGRDVADELSEAIEC